MSANFEISAEEGLRQLGRSLFREGLVAREVVKPIAIFLGNSALYLALEIAILFSATMAVKLTLSVVAGFVTATLFIIAHDCAHGSFTRIPWLNRMLGTLAMMPGLHPYSLWERGHNQVHHRFTMQIARDNAFPPMTPQQFAVSKTPRRFYYRFLRSPVGHLTYYLLEIWLPTMIFPVRRDVQPFKRTYAADLALVWLFVAALIGGLTALKVAAGSEPFNVAMVENIAGINLIFPFAIWMAMISFLTVVQHTHPQARWQRGDGETPSDARAQAEGTIHVLLPEWLDFLLHRVMHHHAHHLQPAIPVYHLKSAQKRLTETAAQHERPFVAARWSPKSHLDMAARCKLYDLENDCWRDFQGRVTGLPAR